MGGVARDSRSDRPPAPGSLSGRGSITRTSAPAPRAGHRSREAMRLTSILAAMPGYDPSAPAQRRRCRAALGAADHVRPGDHDRRHDPARHLERTGRSVATTARPRSRHRRGGARTPRSPRSRRRRHDDDRRRATARSTMALVVHGIPDYRVRLDPTQYTWTITSTGALAGIDARRAAELAQTIVAGTQTQDPDDRHDAGVGRVRLRRLPRRRNLGLRSPVADRVAEHADGQRHAEHEHVRRRLALPRRRRVSCRSRRRAAAAPSASTSAAS